MTNGEVELYGEPFCISCGSSSRYGVEVFNVKAVARRKGWITRGTGISTCPTCGVTAHLLSHRLRVEFQGLACPGCNAMVDYKITLLRVSSGDEITFTAITECPACSHESRFRKVLSKLGRIRRLKIGPTGLEVELDLNDDVSATD